MSLMPPPSSERILNVRPAGQGWHRRWIDRLFVRPSVNISQHLLHGTGVRGMHPRDALVADSRS
jgi:hypothetical protein